MKGLSKPIKVNSLSLAKNAAQFYTKLEFDLHPLLNDQSLAETLEKITLSITKLENAIRIPDKCDTSEISAEFQKTDKSLEKLKTKVNDMKNSLDKIEKTLQEKLISKFEILKKTDPKDATDRANREKVETNMKLIKQVIESAKKKLSELEKPTEQVLKRLHAIKPTLYTLGITENFDRCQKKAEKLSEELGTLCNATAEMALADMAKSGMALLKEITPIKSFLPKLRIEINKSGKLLAEADAHLVRVFLNFEQAAQAAQTTATPVSNNLGTTVNHIISVGNAANDNTVAHTLTAAAVHATEPVRESADSRESKEDKENKSRLAA